jgi:alpha-L-fucosidase
VPPYLAGYEAQYAKDPRGAALEWFRKARFGLFIHYGLYSLHGIHPFEQHMRKVPVAEYEKLKDEFRAEKFDAPAIADLALDTGMKYVTLVTKHCEGFCLWDTKQTDFSSVHSAAGRDLVGEVAEACRKKGLGLFLFYEHGFEWRHPHGPRKKDFPISLVEVPYDPPDPSYAYGDKYDLQKYVDYVSAQITELLTRYGPVAGIWLDGAAVPASGDASKFRLGELYDLIHRLQPQAIVSYKWGVTGKEDFLAPEKAQVSRIKDRGAKPIEVCVPLQPAWGYAKGQARRNADWVMQELRQAAGLGANLLLNIGPLPDGSVHPDDLATLREVGLRLKKDGFPAPEASPAPEAEPPARPAAKRAAKRGKNAK